MANLADVFKNIQKKHGEEIGAFGGFYETAERIPFGVYPLDLSVGGGVPRHRITEIYGPEGSCKTNLTMLLIKQNQIIRPEEKAVVFDMEGTFDPQWAKVMGVDMDTDRVLVLRPNYAEELHDMMLDVIRASDIGICTLDSVAAVVSTREGEGEADKSYMGTAANAIKAMTNKVTIEMKRMRQGESDVKHLPPAMVWINQTRNKIGVVYGDPESTPGGNAPRFAYALRIRVSGKAIMDKAVSETLPAIRKVVAQVKKHKVAITSINCEFDLVMQAHNGFKIGECDDWNLIEQMAKNYGLLVPGAGSKGGYMIGGEQYKTLKAIRARYYAEDDFRVSLQSAVTAIAVQQTGFVQTDEEAAAADQLEEAA